MGSKTHPNDVTCPTCSGGGWQSAAKEMGMEDMPLMHRPIGVWPCTSCHGTGLLIDGAAMEEMTKALKDYIKDNPDFLTDSFLADRALKKSSE